MESYVTLQNEKKAYVSAELVGAFKESMGTMRTISHIQNADFTALAMKAIGLISDYQRQIQGRTYISNNADGKEQPAKEESTDVIMN